MVFIERHIWYVVFILVITTFPTQLYYLARFENKEIVNFHFQLLLYPMYRVFRRSCNISFTFEDQQKSAKIVLVEHTNVTQTIIDNVNDGVSLSDTEFTISYYVF